MRLYAIVLIACLAIITAFSESNISHSNDETKAVGHTGSRDSLTRQIVQPYVTDIEARSSGQTGTEDHSNDVGLSGSTAVRSGERGSNNATSTDSSSAAIYVTPFTGTAGDAYPFGGHLDLRESGYAVPEDLLIVENAGSFGQRVRQSHLGDKNAARNTDDRQSDDYASYRKSFSSTVSLLEDRGGRSYAFTTREPLKEEHGSADDSPISESKAIGSQTFAKNFNEVFGAASATEVEPLDEKNVAPNEQESKNVAQSQARPSQRYNGTTDETTKLKLLETPIEKLESVATSTSVDVEISPSLQLTRFSGPIVVADLPNEETRDVVVDYLDSDNSDASGIRSFGKIDGKADFDARDSKTATSNDITMSSIMLKPLQVGITLVNADEAALAIDNEQSAATDTDYIQNDLQRLAIADGALEHKGNQSQVNYGDESLQRVEKEKPVEAVTQKALGNSVEIQKSIEIFHTAPVHEIHYPVEYIRQTSNLGVIETNNIGNAQRWKQSHVGQDERSELQSNYDVYQGNDQVEKNVFNAHASTVSQIYNRHAHEIPVNKPTTTALIGGYSSNIREQTPNEQLESQPSKYNVLQPVLLIPSQSGDALQHDQSDLRYSFNDVLPRAKPIGSSSARQEVGTNKHVKTYASSGTYHRTQQLQQSSQPIDQQHSFRSSETRRPEAQQQLLLKIVPNGSAGNGEFLVPLRRPYPIEKIVEKTVHVSHPVEVEKVIEKTVPFPVDRVVERQVPVQVQVPVPVPVPVPQPYPVHVMPVMPEQQIRVQHLYPIQKQAPYTFVRRPQQPSAYPLHVGLPAVYPTAHAYPAEKTVEKPIVASASLRSPRPTIDSSSSSSIDTTFDKYRQKSNIESILVIPRGSPGEPAARPSDLNASRFHHGDPGYGQPLTAYNYVNGLPYPDVRLMILPRGYNSHAVTSRPHAIPSLYTVPVSVRRQISYNLVEKDEPTKSDEYMGPVSLAHKSVPRSKTRSPHYSTNITAQSQSVATTRKSRQPDTRYPGSFRQSKMEYGFKPPMVPSVQYDESTATKVEN